MSLDVYLKQKKDNQTKETNISSERIFVRENGQTIEISQEEWNMRFPGKTLVSVKSDFVEEQENECEQVFSYNITHNLNKMAQELGVYEHLWRPEEINITEAKQLIDPLRNALHDLKMNPVRFKAFNPENGWGSYEGLVKFIESYLNACYEYPNAKVEVWR